MLQNTGTSSMLKMILLPLLAGLILTFQNCAPAQVEVGGGVSTTAQLSVAPGTSAEVEAIFQTVLGRLPTATELAQYASLLAAGMSSADLTSLLAGSSTTSSSIADLLKKYLGTSNTATVSYYQDLVKNSGYSVKDVESVLKKYAKN